jgi:tetratricopeptide (TPR) repeat protein
MHLKKLSALTLTIATLLIAGSPALSNNDSYQKASQAADLCNQAIKMADHNSSQALDLYKQACLLDPNDNSANVHTNLAIFLENTGRIDESISEYDKALHFDPNSTAAKHGLGSALCEKGVQLTHAEKYEEAKHVYDQAIAIQPLPPSDIAEIRTGLGILLEKMGKMEDAVAQYKLGLDSDAENRDAIYNIGCCYEHIGDVEQAKKYFTKYITDFPSEPNRKEVQATLASLNRKKALVDQNKDSSDYFLNVTADGIELWPKKTMPLKVFISSAKNIPGFQQSFTEILIASFDAWIKAAGNYLSWQLVPNENDADIVCHWTNNRQDLKFQGAEQGETYRDFIANKDGQNMIVHAGMKLCFVDAMSEQILSDKAISALCLHEVGHALGLKGHSPNRNDIMFFASGEIYPLRQLSARDIATINRLYSTYQAKLETP